MRWNMNMTDGHIPSFANSPPPLCIPGRRNDNHDEERPVRLDGGVEPGLDQFGAVDVVGVEGGRQGTATLAVMPRIKMTCGGDWRTRSINV